MPWQLPKRMQGAQGQHMFTTDLSRQLGLALGVIPLNRMSDSCMVAAGKLIQASNTQCVFEVIVRVCLCDLLSNCDQAT